MHLLPQGAGVAVELIQVVKPEVVAVEVSVRRIVGITAQVTEVLHDHEGAVEFVRLNT
jgi:hypothetical protein